MAGRRHSIRAGVERIIARLPLPPAAVLDGKRRDGDQDYPGLLAAATVLAKASGSVWLRAKEPDLTALIPGRRVIVVVPLAWRPER